MNDIKGSLVFEGEVLLCEDNRMNQEIVSDRLAKLGLKAIVAENGKEGVELVASRVQNGIKPFDLVFMDMYMPVMDGLEAAVEIGKLNTGAPIIAMSANSALTRREQYAAAGIFDYVNKPFTSRELLDCLMKYLRPMAQDASGSKPVDLQTLELNSLKHGFLDKAQDTEVDEKLRNKLIYFFMDSNKTIFGEITKAIEAGDIKTAHRLAHSLKSNANMLGKTRLQKAAEDVQKLLLNEESLNLASLMDQFSMSALKTELDAVLKEFTPLMDEIAQSAMNTGTKSETLNEEQTRALLDELELLLDGGDIECLNLIDNIRLIPGNGGLSSEGQVSAVSMSRQLIQQLVQQIEYFEFDKALKTLLRLKKECRIGDE